MATFSMPTIPAGVQLTFAEVDGGVPATPVFAAVIDGGYPATVVFDAVVNGGGSSDSH